jgi:DNA-binding PadR family transcriptional regulator
MAPRLSTTSYAVLGMFAIRDWTPYELTQQMLRSLAYCWPTSERALYNEPEKLTSAGMLERHEDTDGGRVRRTYAITQRGREALAEWLGTEPATPKVFSEPLLRLLLADQGGLDDLRSSLRTFGASTAAAHQAGRDQMAGYLDGTGLFPERAHLVAGFAVLVDRIFAVQREWVAEMLAEIDGWPGTRGLGLTPTAERQLRDVVDGAR